MSSWLGLQCVYEWICCSAEKISLSDLSGQPRAESVLSGHNGSERSFYRTRDVE